MRFSLKSVLGGMAIVATATWLIQGTVAVQCDSILAKRDVDVLISGMKLLFNEAGILAQNGYTDPFMIQVSPVTGGPSHKVKVSYVRGTFSIQPNASALRSLECRNRSSTSMSAVASRDIISATQNLDLRFSKSMPFANCIFYLPGFSTSGREAVGAIAINRDGASLMYYFECERKADNTWVAIGQSIKAASH